MSEPLQVGDKVQWTKTSTSGRSFSMVLRQATVLEVAGDQVKVRTEGRRIKWMPARGLQRQGERSAIAAVVEAMRDNARGGAH